MRDIQNQCLKTMVSPVRFLMYHIPNAIVNIAKEREAEFGKLHEDFILRFVDSDEFICHVNVECRLIEVSKFAAEIAWASSLAYVSLYEKCVKKRNPTELATVSLDVVATEMQALGWAYRKYIDKDYSIAWPEKCPEPKLECKFSDIKTEEEKVLYVVQEVAHCALAFMLHHEFAHIRLSHHKTSYSNRDKGPDAESIDMERDADYEAVRFILEGKEETPGYDYQRRYLGIATALLVFTNTGIHTGWFNGITHPRSFDRLYNVFSNYLSDRDHPVWAYIVSMMKLHLDNSSVDFDKAKTYNHFQDAVDDYVEVLSKQKVPS